MRYVLKALTPLNKTLVMMASAVLAIMMLHISADVVARAFLSQSIGPTVEIVTGYYMPVVAAMCWGAVALSDGHIFVEVFSKGFSPKVNRFLDRIVFAVSLVATVVFLQQTAIKAYEAMLAGDTRYTSIGYLAVWPARWVFPAGAFILGIAFLIKTIAPDLRDEPPSEDV